MKRLIGMTVLLFIMFSCAVGAIDEYDEKTAEFYNEVLLEEGKERASGNITRSEFLSVVMKLCGYTKDIYICSFYDVLDMNWDYVYAANAEDRDIARGDSGAFFGERDITVEEAAAFLMRTFKNGYRAEGFTDDTGASGYSLDYIAYCRKMGIYPLEGGKPVRADSYFKTDKALRFIADFMRAYDGEKNSLRFSEGYPRMIESGRVNSLGFLIKTNKPCTVYYKISQADTLGALTPKGEDITDYLVSVSKAGYEIKTYITARQNIRYNVNMVLKSDDGEQSMVYSIKDISPLPFTMGDGSASNPYRIYTDYQLEQIRYYPDKAFILCNDIDFIRPWQPVDNFSGIFDGNGFAVKKLKIAGGDHAGFFARINGGTVKELSLYADVSAEGYAGIFAGEVVSGEIRNCHAAGSVSASGNIAGAVCGKNGGRIRNCLAVAEFVGAAAYSGGICGSNTGEVSKCISACPSVSAGMYASGIAGANIGGKISDNLVISSEISDPFTKNSGRITTNKQGGSCSDNFAYENMLSGLDINLGKDTHDGEDVSWEDIKSLSFYTGKMKLDFSKDWSFDNRPEFMIPCVKGVETPDIEEGSTFYRPVIITDEEGLRRVGDNASKNYYLAENITLHGIWEPIFVSDGPDSYEKGFSGTFDGGGHTIYSMRINSRQDISQYGLFGTIYGGTVRDLSLSDINIKGHTEVGGICAVNYGIIENCNTSGNIYAYKNNRETLAAGIAAVNYTNITKTVSSADISIFSNSITAGGICAENEGFIDRCSYNARIDASDKKTGAIAVMGGIAGINYSGMIYDSYAGRGISSDLSVSYCGGIVGIQNDGEIYKCSSSGTVSHAPSAAEGAVSYTGGIAGMSSGGIVMNSFSLANVSAKADRAYSGGIGGFFENSSIQNCYSANSVNQLTGGSSGEAFSGGIAGYADNTDISGTVAINPYIMTNGTPGRICGYSEGGTVFDNFYYEGIYINSKVRDEEGANKASMKELENNDFFFLPADMGGGLGWNSTVYYGGDVWAPSGRRNYPFPVLYDVMNQASFLKSRDYR